jgi:hypothetical protein
MKAVSELICGRLDPFCKSSLSAKRSCFGDFRTLTANISDILTVGTSTDAGSGNEYIAYRAAAGLKANQVKCTMLGDEITSVSVFNSSWIAAFGDSNYRVVGYAVRAVYTGPILTAAGWFRVFKTGPVKSITSTSAAGSGMPDKPGDVTCYYWDFSPTELMKGVTVFLNAVTPDADNFDDNDSTAMSKDWEGFSLFGMGLDPAATVTFEIRQVIEINPIAGSLEALSATPNAQHNSFVDTAFASLSGKVDLIEGPVGRATKEIARLALATVNKLAPALLSAAKATAFGATTYALKNAGPRLLGA